MKKISIILGSAFLAFSLTMAPAFAQGIIPKAEAPYGEVDCDSVSDIGGKIQCGTVSLNDVPILIIYLIQWVLTLAGSIAVIMIMVGAFQYMLGGVTDDKERGKKTLIYAIGGLVVAFMAWWIVELVQVWITS